MALEETCDRTIKRWARALDLRDEITEGHTRRATELTIRLARRLNVPDDQLPHIRRGATLHDTGKMVVPNRILRKPGPFSAEEEAQMRQHVVHAYDILWPVKFLRPALEIPACHHERWDGTGYPRGLKGEAIPFTARIFAVADVYDAMRSDRPCDKAESHAAALAHIVRVVDALLALEGDEGIAAH